MENQKKYKGYNGTLILFDSSVVIKRGIKGFLLGGGKLQGDKTIPYSSIVAIQLKKAGITAGYIQLILKGDSEAKGGLFQSVNDENSINFYSNKNKDFEEAKGLIEKYINEDSQKNSNNLNDFENNLENKKTLSRQQEIEQEEKTRVIAREKAENELKKEKEKKDLKTGTIGCIVLVVIIVLISIFSSGGKDKNSVNWAEQDNSTMAYIKVESFVKQNLKSPSSANFPGVLNRDGHVIKGDDHKYLINSYVDSQNSFGAEIRTYFTATVQQVDENNWKLIDIKFLGN